jgi:putative endopeptidase
VPGIDPGLVQRTVDPCADFYQFACGGWLERTTMPDDQSRWVRSFSVMREQNKLKLRAILDAAAAGPVAPEDRYGQQVADLYAACMDEPAIEKAGLASLKGRWKALQARWKGLEAVTDARSLSATVGRLQAGGVQVLFGIGSRQDAGDSTTVIGAISQGGLFGATQASAARASSGRARFTGGSWRFG